MSRRARSAAMKRETAKLFAGVDLAPRSPPQPSEKERLLREAAMLEDLASRGMCVRKYPKLAAAMRARAESLP